MRTLVQIAQQEVTYQKSLLDPIGADQCPQPPVVRDVSVRMVAQNGHIYTCNEGYLFDDGTASKQIVCSPRGTWTPAIGSCNSRYFDTVKKEY